MSVAVLQRQRLEARVAALEQELLATKAEWNELTLPGRLPPEILLRIFKNCRDEWLTDSCKRQHSQTRSQYYSEPSSYGSYDLWLRNTHVCNHWRRLALSDPSLWTQLRPHTLARTEAFLQRSQQMPLSVTWAMEEKDNTITEILRLVLEHSSRIRSLRIHYLRTGDSYRAWDVHQFPQLRRLSLFHKHRPPFIQPTQVFPLLEEIRLNQYGLANALSIISTQSARLTRLHLNNCETRRFRSGWATFFKVMAEIAPRLQELALTEALPSEPGVLFTSGKLRSIVPVIQMPHLRSLRIHDSAIAPATVLHHLSFPASVSIMLACHTAMSYGQQSSDPHVVILFGALERALAVNVLGSPRVFDDVSVAQLDSDTALHTEGRAREEGTANGHTYPAPAPVTLRFTNHRKLTGVIELAVKFTPWRDAERLYIDRRFERAYYSGEPYVLTGDSWRTVLGALPRLRELSVPDRGETSLLSALLPIKDQAVACPALDVLQLRSVSFKDDPPAAYFESEEVTGRPCRPHHFTKERWVRSMSTIIRKRRALQLGPSELRIHHHLNPAPLHELSQHGPHIQLVPETYETNQYDEPGKISLLTDGDRDSDDSGAENYFGSDSDL
ncbi:hypothetical protein PsYK624_099930 [Phanerochaete sordida]|uniref:F-box domain-containing protein n=1 Tax=Phanerochaete sordida TaxID=48140 RepID=A0A9P3GHQ4_9APHY|nr:hypothetical protein PsYK624_099930 [Phanerochaete sordida]